MQTVAVLIFWNRKLAKTILCLSPKYYSSGSPAHQHLLPPPHLLTCRVMAGAAAEGNAPRSPICGLLRWIRSPSTSPTTLASNPSPTPPRSPHLSRFGAPSNAPVAAARLSIATGLLEPLEGVWEHRQRLPHLPRPPVQAGTLYITGIAPFVNLLPPHATASICLLR